MVIRSTDPSEGVVPTVMESSSQRTTEGLSLAEVLLQQLGHYM